MDMLGTLTKAQQVLDLYTTTQPEWGVTEVARALDLPPSSVHLLMASLAEMGLLHRTLAGRYRLGFKLLKLSQVLLANTPWRDVLILQMQHLSQELGETTHAVALDGAHLITVGAAQGRLAGAIWPALISEELPLHASAAGKVMLAFRAGQSLSQPRNLLAELAKIRQDGLAWNLGERGGQIHALAAPIYNHSGEVIAALSVLTPPQRFQTQREVYARALGRTARQVSEQLDWVSSGSQMVWVSVQGTETLKRARKRR